MTRVAGLDARPWARWASTVATVGIVAAFAVALTVPLDRLEGKGMGFRAPFFVGSALVVPVWWWFDRRRPYPHIAHALVVAPFLLDTLGNLLGAYDAYDRTDDVLHAVNWVLLVLAFHAVRFRVTDRADSARLLGAGVGALAIVGWEIAEWIVAETGAGGGLALTYGDTVGDLALSTTGGIVGSLLGVAWFGPGAVRS